MAARRNRRGQRRNRGRFGFLYKLLSFVLILAAIIVGCAVFFRVDKVEVSGQVRYTQEQIVQAAGVEERDNLFLLNKFQMARQILARLPYVDEVIIYRDWPDTLVIEVRESVAVAAVQSPDAWWLVNAKGKIVERTDAAGAAGYPAITGLTPVTPLVGNKLETESEQSLKLQSLMDLLAVLEELGMLEQADSFDLSAVNEIAVGYMDRFTIKLPMSGREFGPLLRGVDKAIRESLDETDAGVFDATLKDIHFIPSA